MNSEQIRLAIRDLSRNLNEEEGDIEFMGATDDGVVNIRLLGQCAGCSSKLMIKNFIELNLKRKFPEVERVVAVKA
jgi:Fe-S cluster biogenesis protein NfuA